MDFTDWKDAEHSMGVRKITNYVFGNNCFAIFNIFARHPLWPWNLMVGLC